MTQGVLETQQSNGFIFLLTSHFLLKVFVVGFKACGVSFRGF